MLSAVFLCIKKAATYNITHWLLHTISHTETLLNVLNFKYLSHIVFV